MKNLIFKGLNGPFKIATATQYITRIKDSTKKSAGISDFGEVGRRHFQFEVKLEKCFCRQKRSGPDEKVRSKP